MELIDDGYRMLESPSAAAAKAAVQDMADRGARTVLLLAADGNAVCPDDFDSWLRELSVTIAGGVFPQLIYGGRNHEQGYLVLGLAAACPVKAIGGLSTADADFADEIERTGATAGSSTLVLLDGLASQIGAFLDGVYDVFGGAPTYFGGGAGSLSFEHRPCLFSNAGMLMDHALLVSLPGRVTVGVEHGWQKFAGPFAVTGAERNRVLAIDYRPASALYRELVEQDSGRRFDGQNFFDIAKGYPLGMEKPGGALVVRDPISSDGDALVCVGEVPANSVIYLLKGEAARLVSAAAASARRIPSGTSPAFLVDCISRVLFLQERFGEELAAVKAEVGERPVFGVLTLGEVANGGDYCLEFYNKTLVLAAAP